MASDYLVPHVARALLPAASRLLGALAFFILRCAPAAHDCLSRTRLTAVHLTNRKRSTALLPARKKGGPLETLSPIKRLRRLLVRRGFPNNASSRHNPPINRLSLTLHMPLSAGARLGPYE